jgi:ferredoxin-NADP reductase
MEKIYTFELIEIKQETEDIKSFVFSALDNEFMWTAGQYLDWQFPHANADERGERRWFSIASAPSEGVVMLSCRFASDGSTLKKRLLELKVGDRVEAKGPMGEFTLEEVREKTVLIAGGIGITPFRAIIKELAAKNGLQNITLVHGNKSPENVPFIGEMSELSNENEGFSLHYTYSPTIIDAGVVASLAGGLDDTVFMISGLEKMVESIRHSLLEAGVGSDKIRIDDFGGYDWHLDKPIY